MILATFLATASPIATIDIYGARRSVAKTDATTIGELLNDTTLSVVFTHELTTTISVDVSTIRRHPSCLLRPV